MWSQMELVTDMLTALREHDTKAIQATRTKVEDLAARLAPATKPDNEPDSPGHDEHQNADEEKDSTLTVGNLLDTSTATQIIDNSAPSELGDDKTIESRSYGN
jgi:hypothetical protein